MLAHMSIHFISSLQILDLANVKIESEEDFKAVIEKIPDYRIKPERVSESVRVQSNPLNGSFVGT